MRIVRNTSRSGRRHTGLRHGAAVYAPEFYVWDPDPGYARRWGAELLEARQPPRRDPDAPDPR